MTTCRQVFSLRLEPWNVAISKNVVLMGLGKRNSLEDVVDRRSFMINSNFYEAQDLLNNSRLNVNPQVVTKHRNSLLTHLKLLLIGEPSVTNQQFV